MDKGFLQETKSIIKSIVLSSPHRIDIDTLKSEFKLTVGYEIPYRKLGFLDVESFLQTISDTVLVIGKGPSATLQFVPNVKLNHIHQLVREQKTNTTKSSKSKYRNRPRSYKNEMNQPPNVSQLTNTFSKIAINSEEKILLDNYHNKSDVHNKNSKKQYDSHNQLECRKVDQSYRNNKEQHCESVSDNTILPPSPRNYDNINFENDNEETINLLKTYDESNADEEEAVPIFSTNNWLFEWDFPENTVAYGLKIKPYKVPINIKTGSILGIYIAQVHDPYKFWFHIRTEENELHELMHTLNHFYKYLDKNQYSIPSEYILPGQVCTALFDNVWHRAEIISKMRKNMVKVYFMDYGTVSEVSIDNLKCLSKSFFELPGQALRGSLSHIKPRCLHWDREGISRFSSMVSGVMMYAKISEIDERNRIFYMVLCDANNDKMVQINKTLVEENFAYFDDKWRNNKFAGNKKKRRHHKRENFPTFSMLECGQYPTLDELDDMTNQGIDYECITDSYIFHSEISNENESASESSGNFSFKLKSTNPFYH